MKWLDYQGDKEYEGLPRDPVDELRFLRLELIEFADSSSWMAMRYSSKAATTYLTLDSTDTYTMDSQAALTTLEPGEEICCCRKAYVVTSTLAEKQLETMSAQFEHEVKRETNQSRRDDNHSTW